MSTALRHPHLHLHRSQLIAAGAAVLAVVAAGAVFEATHDDAPTATGEPGISLSLPPHHLHGSGTMHGNWEHAGTTSGGRTMTGE
jgi:hypothetical protein